MIALVSATVAVVYYSPGPLAYVRYGLGSLFVLYLPGSALIELLYPKKTDLSHWSGALSIWLSSVVSSRARVNFTPWGLRLTPIVVSLPCSRWGYPWGRGQECAYRNSPPRRRSPPRGARRRGSLERARGMRFHLSKTGLRRWIRMAATDRIERRAKEQEPHPPYSTMPLHYEAELRAAHPGTPHAVRGWCAFFWFIMGTSYLTAIGSAWRSWVLLAITPLSPVHTRPSGGCRGLAAEHRGAPRGARASGSGKGYYVPGGTGACRSSST
jgi:hypothetical protein